MKALIKSKGIFAAVMSLLVLASLFTLCISGPGTGDSGTVDQGIEQSSLIPSTTSPAVNDPAAGQDAWETGQQTVQDTGTQDESSTGTDSGDYLPSEKVIESVDYDTDILDQPDESEVSRITFDGDSITAEGDVEVDGSVVYISSGGSYLVSGSSDGGRIVIESGDKETVNLILNGLDLTSTEGAPIEVKEAKRTVLTIVEGSINTLTDRSPYVDPDSLEDAVNAAIYSRDDLYIHGSGSLDVESVNGNGIQSKDQLVIVEGDLTVDAAKEALKAKDYVYIEGGTLSLTAGEDGISATEDEDPGKGFVVISGGSIDIDAGLDGVQAETYVIITGGSLDITTAGGSSKRVADTISAKGIKATRYVEIDGGVINIDSVDDAVHGDSVTVNGGTITVITGDDGFHGDSALSINGGSVTVGKSYEGLESRNIYISGGTIRVYASDDGINIADGSSNMRMGEMALENARVEISGGDVYIECEGDGLDSNGDLYMAGGNVIVNGPIRDNNGGIDVNGKCVVDGGFLVVASSLGMAESPDQTSTQNSVKIGFASQMPAGTLVHIESADGADIITFAPSKSFQAFVLSTGDLETGKTYKVYTGGTATGGEVDGLYVDGTYEGGTLYVEFTVTGTSTTAGSASGMGGMGRGGRMPMG